jgi:hypothetical protein
MPLIESLEHRLQLSITPVAAATSVASAADDQDSPAVAMDAAGDYVVVWTDDLDNTGIQSTIEAEVFKANGTTVGPFTVNSSASPDPTTRQQPSVAMDANGDFVVAWGLEPANTPANGGYYYDIEARRFGLSGVGQGNEFQVNTTQQQTPNDLLSPTVAMNNSSFVIGWTDVDGSGSKDTIEAQRYTFSGATNTPAGSNTTVYSAFTSTDPKAAMDTAGDYVFVWNPYNGTNNLVLGQVYNASGLAQGSTFSVDPSVDPITPSVAMNGAGDFVVAVGSISNGKVYAHQYALTGTESSLSASSLSGDVALFTQSSPFDQSDPAAAIDSQGFATVVWQDYSTANDSADGAIDARRLNPDGTTIEAAPIQVAAPNASDDLSHPGAAANPGGNLIVDWEIDVKTPPPPGGTGESVEDRLYHYVNDAPTITTIGTPQSVAENGTLSVPLAGIGAGGGEEQTLTVTASSSNTALIDPSGSVTYTSPNATGTLSLAPKAGQSGSATITVTVTDSGGTANSGMNSTSTSFTLNVTAPAPPTANGQSVNVPHDSSGTAITLAGSDPNNLPLTFAIATEPTHGTLSGFNASTGAVTYKPTPGYHGTDTFTFTDNNGTTTSSPATVTLNVAVGTPAANPQTVAVAHDSSGTAITLTSTDDDTPTLTETYAFTQPSHGTVAVSGAAGSPTVTYTPAVGYHGSDSFTFTANNGTNSSTSATVMLNVAVGTPTANPQTVSTAENTALNVTLTGSDDDLPALSLTFALVSGPGHSPANGTITGFNPVTGALTYTPAAGFHGSDTFDFTVSNGTNVSATGTVTVNTTAATAATITAVSADWGTNGTIALQTAGDGLRLLPTGRNTDLPWYGINKLQITLSQSESLSSGDVSVTGISVASYGPVTISGSGTNYTITFAQAITTADRVTVTIGNAGITTFTRRLDVLPGDVNDDGTVNAQDLVLVRNDFAVFGATYAVVDDLNGDGTVDINDTNLLGRFIGKKLPTLALA